MNKQRAEIMNFMTKEEFINESNIEIIQNLWKEIMDISLRKNLKNLI